jgi:beta-aspartyl-peptidase (threonine type)
MSHRPILAVHGGAIFDENDFDPSRDKDYREALEHALRSGYHRLDNGGSALDGIEIAIRMLEDCGLFDAGRGAVFTYDGKNELDASIMDGRTKKAGAVAGVNHIKSPISAARKVMEETWHVMLSGIGAEEFAKSQGLELVDPSYFFNEEKWRQHTLLKAAKDNVTLDAAVRIKPREHETVGAVAMDTNGNLAAGTSTGGLDLKLWGRVGDSPIIGAGTYADNATCAVSCTGQGEYFIRNAVAYDVSARMKYQQSTLEQAVHGALKNITDDGGNGGLIALDAKGNLVMDTTTRGMFRGYIRDVQTHIEILK